MIEIRNLHKHFISKDAKVHAVDDVSLSIGDGEVYGIMGYSGAGKSTLVRCLNFLEIPESGTVEISGFGAVSSEGGKLYLKEDKGARPLSEKELRQLRRSMGMIFQHFNLLDRSTVFDNIAQVKQFHTETGIGFI